jgi:hypothetical protein
MTAIQPDYSKRDCSLPPGCKDLIDVLRLTKSPVVMKPLELGKPVSVRALAALLGCKPLQIIADLLELKILATVDQAVSFEVAAKIAVKYGLLAKRAWTGLGTGKGP